MEATDRSRDHDPDPGRSGRLRIAILYDGGADDWTAEDIQSVLEPVWAVSKVLTAAGHRVSRVQVGPGLGWLAEVRAADLIFNLCEGIGGISHLEYRVASAIELTGVPFTGAGTWTMAICHRKPLLNAWLETAGLPIPAWKVVRSGEVVPADFPLPAIIKPAAEDASVGIDQGSVVTSRDALGDRVSHLAGQFAELIVQRYIAGRELAVAFVGDSLLPLSEIDFGGMPTDAWPILSFDAKWAPGSADDLGSQPVCPASVDPVLEERVISVAEAAWRAVEGSGYGRVDLRVDADGQPWIIEVNPNPDISTDAGLARMARAGGWTYPRLVKRIVQLAVADGKQNREGRARSSRQLDQAAVGGRGT